MSNNCLTVNATTELATRRRPDAYETPTPEKIEAGRRMAYARQMAGLDQVEAAQLLGYSQGVQLSLMEAGKRPVPFDKLIAAAKLYDTTLDYLCGLVDDPDRDPAAALLRSVQAHVETDVGSLVRGVFASNAKRLGELLPNVAAADRLASLTAEVGVAMAVFAARNASFLDMPAGAPLAAKVELASQAAKAYAEKAASARRVMRTRIGSVDANDLLATGPILETNGAKSANEDEA
jgi:transcriptional regulator with XRE-family HTH domain